MYSTELELTVGSEDKVFLYYKGTFEQVVVSNLLESFRENEDSELSRIMKRLFSVSVEIVQNIARHSSERSIVKNTAFDDIGIGSLIVIEKTDRYSVVATNKVQTLQAKHLNEYIKKISNSNHDELRAMKRELLSRPLEANQRSGRIGLIQIALKADLPIEGSYLEIDNEYSYFLLAADIKRK